MYVCVGEFLASGIRINISDATPGLTPADVTGDLKGVSLTESMGS